MLNRQLALQIDGSTEIEETAARTWSQCADWTCLAPTPYMIVHIIPNALPKHAQQVCGSAIHSS